jgi:hypothetical protein
MHDAQRNYYYGGVPHETQHHTQLNQAELSVRCKRLQVGWLQQGKPQAAACG